MRGVSHHHAPRATTTPFAVVAWPTDDGPNLGGRQLNRIVVAYLRMRLCLWRVCVYGTYMRV